MPKVIEVSPAELLRDPVWQQAAIDAAARFTYGDLIPKSWLWEHLEVEALSSISLESPEAAAKDLERRNLDFASKYQQFANHMLKQYHMLLRNARSEGYRIVKPEEHTDVAVGKATNDVQKALRKGATELRHAPFDQLTAEQIRHNSDSQGKLAFLSRVVKKPARYMPEPKTKSRQLPKDVA